MRDNPLEEFERQVQAQLRRESERLVRVFDADSVAQKAMQPQRALPQRLVLTAGTVAVAAILMLSGIALSSRLSNAGSATNQTSAGSPSADALAISVQAQNVLDKVLGSQPGTPAAAAFITTSWANYAAKAPAAGGIQVQPSPSDTILVVEVEGLFPSTHSCGFVTTACFDTAIEITYNATTGETVDIAYIDDPASPDRPSPAASVSQRFRDLREWGVPVPLQVGN